MVIVRNAVTGFTGLRAVLTVMNRQEICARKKKRVSEQKQGRAVRITAVRIAGQKKGRRYITVSVWGTVISGVVRYTGYATATVRENIV